MCRSVQSPVPLPCLHIYAEPYLKACHARWTSLPGGKSCQQTASCDYATRAPKGAFPTTRRGTSLSVISTRVPNLTCGSSAPTTSTRLVYGLKNTTGRATAWASQVARSFYFSAISTPSSHVRPGSFACRRVYRLARVIPSAGACTSARKSTTPSSPRRRTRTFV